MIRSDYTKEFFHTAAAAACLAAVIVSGAMTRDIMNTRRAERFASER